MRISTTILVDVKNNDITGLGIQMKCDSDSLNTTTAWLLVVICSTVKKLFFTMSALLCKDLAGGLTLKPYCM